MNRYQRHMESCGYLMELLRACLNGEETPLLPKGLSWTDIYQTAKTHSVESMAFYQAERMLRREPALYGEWRKRKDQNLMQSMLQMAEKDRLVKYLTAAGIRVIPLKGCCMKELYGREDWRQMADVDLLVEEKDMAAAMKILEKSGFQKEYELTEQEYHIEYRKPPYLDIELHRFMFMSDSVYAQYFSDIWQRAKPDPENAGIFLLTPEDFYLYMLAHFQKHYMQQYGSGVRILADVYVFLQRFGAELDRAYLASETEKLGLTKTEQELRELALFHLSPEKSNRGKLSAGAGRLQSGIFYSGSYGAMQKKMSDALWGKTPGERRRYLWKRIFMDREELAKYCYPNLAKWPALYPVYVLRRLVRAVFHQRELIRDEWAMLRHMEGQEPREEDGGDAGASRKSPE